MWKYPTVYGLALRSRLVQIVWILSGNDIVLPGAIEPNRHGRILDWYVMHWTLNVWCSVELLNAPNRFPTPPMEFHFTRLDYHYCLAILVSLFLTWLRVSLLAKVNCTIDNYSWRINVWEHLCVMACSLGCPKCKPFVSVVSHLLLLHLMFALARFFSPKHFCFLCCVEANFLALEFVIVIELVAS